METDPFPVNTTATTVNSAIDGIFNIAVKITESTMEAALDAEVPLFALPVMSIITNDVINWIVETAANSIYQQFAKYVTFGIIDIQVGSEENNVASALSELKKAQIGGDNAAIHTALQNFGKAVASLTNFDGSANPGNL